MTSVDGLQSAGLNYNSIDGLTTVNATSVTINGSTINLANYIPYVGAVSNPDFNTRLLRNIGNATNPQDAVALSQLGSYVPYTGATTNVDLNTRLLRNIGNALLSTDAVAFGQLSSYIPYTGAVSNPNFNTRLLTNIGDGVSNNDAISLQQLNAKRYDIIQNGAASVYAFCGLSNLTLQAAPSGRVDIGSKVIIAPLSTDAVDTFEVRNLAGASKFYVDTTVTNRSQFTTALTVRTSANATAAFDVKDSGLTSLFTINTVTPTINCLTTASMNSNKITNLANGTASSDAVNFGQLSTISSLITGAGLPAGSLQGSYVLHNGTNYINASTSRVSLGISSLSTNPTLLTSTFGTVAIGALAANIDSGFHSLVATATINYDASGLTLSASNPTMTNTGTLGGTGIKSSGVGNATVVNSGIIGSLNELSIPSNCVYQFGTGAGLTYPNMTVAAVFRTPAGNGFFIEHGFTFNTNPSFYLSNGIPYFGGPTYYTNQCVGVRTDPALDDFQTTAPRNINGTNGFGSGLGTESYTIAIMTFSATATIFQCYLIPTNNTAILNQTQYGPYTKTYAAMGSATNASNNIFINRRNAQAQILCQMLVFNQTFTQEQVSQLQNYLRVKWFSNISGNLSNNISVGYASGFSKQSFNSVAIGPWAGSSSQGVYSVAIGNKAGQNAQPDYSIVINGMESALNPTTSGLFIDPIRNLTNDNRIYYNSAAKELTYINDNAYWSLFSNTQSGGFYCFIYQASLPTQGYWGDFQASNYLSNVNTNFGTAVWENPINPTTRSIIITIPYNGMYQLNVACGGSGPIGRFIVYVNLTISGVLKNIEVIDYWTQATNYYENEGWSGLYYLPAGSTISYTGAGPGTPYASFSGFLVRRI